MTKTELMENYKAEQLADMVINLQSASEVKNDEIHKMKWQISSLEEDNGRLQAKLDTYNNYLLPRCTKEAKEMIDLNHFSGVTVVSLEQFDNRIKKESNEPDIRGYEETIDWLQSEVEKYRKAFEDAKKERDCQIAEYKRKIDELKVENAELHCEMQALKVFPDEIPTEPIKVAEMLITAKGECEPLHIGNDVLKDTYRIFDVSELRQIAEHLLVYCNHNGEPEE